MANPRITPVDEMAFDVFSIEWSVMLYCTSGLVPGVMDSVSIQLTSPLLYRKPASRIDWFPWLPFPLSVSQGVFSASSVSMNL